MVVEQGVYQLSGGGQLVAGKQNVTQSNTTNFTNISYAQRYRDAERQTLDDYSASC